MSKPTNTHLIIPGESSWEIWSAPAAQAPTIVSEHPVNFPAEIDKLPTGDLIFFFPVRALTTIPLKVLTTDESLFQDLATTHAERLGLRPDPMAGQLSDLFPVSISSDSATIVSVVLRNPRTQDLPLKSPKSFDISPRTFSITGNTLVLWRELGNWNFAIYLNGKLLYAQASSNSSPSPDENLIRDIRLAIAQITLQDIQAIPSKAIVFSSNPDTETSLLSRTLSVVTELTPRPAPSLPSPLSKLLPADVRAARRAAQKRQNLILTSVALGVLYLGTIAYFAFQLYTVTSTNKKLLIRINAIAPERESYDLHNAKWQELQPALAPKNNTTDILHRIQRCIPPNSGLRIKTADISPNSIVITGRAQQAQAIKQFSLNLTKSNDLLDYEWQLPEPTPIDNGWDFNYNAAPPALSP